MNYELDLSIPQYIEIKTNKDKRGDLFALEQGKEIPFEVKRVFFIENVPVSAERGNHCNIDAEELIVCVNGYCKVHIENNLGQIWDFFLNSENRAIYIPKNTWRVINSFSENTKLAILSDTLYNKEMYQNDYFQFRGEKI